ncbi:MAG: hypothetical protein Q8N63_03930 [Nanoarchaeota archaeon]|nr:hypothetical protein [Nanoarchaeota archaeon]
MTLHSEELKNLLDKYLDRHKNPLQEGFYIHEGGRLFYLSQDEQGWIGESLKGLVFRVLPHQSEGFSPKNLENQEGLSEHQKEFIKSKLGQSTQSPEHPFGEWGNAPLDYV